MDASWFELKDVERQNYQKSPFVPLRLVSDTKLGQYAFDGYQNEFYAVTSAAFRVEDQLVAESQAWGDLGLRHTFEGYEDDGRYFPGDEIVIGNQPETHAVPLVIVSGSIGQAGPEWYLHQDFVVSLRLRREGDAWLSPDEGYREVGRLVRDTEGRPIRLEVARDYLLDYLTARGMGLWMLTFRQRMAVVDAEPDLAWPDGQMEVQRGTQDVIHGRTYAVHEGSGMPFGERMAVFHGSRTDVDPQDEVPHLGPPTDDNTTTSAFETGFAGRKLHLVTTERYRNEWIAPSGFSPRIRRDDEGQHVQFHIDASGMTRAISPDVYGSWVWFRPEVVPAMLRFRDAQLSWYSRDTGSLAAVPGHGLHFGVNALGLVTIYAKDVAELPIWQQRLMAAHSVIPEGGVGDELLASQVRAAPADTLAPEDRLVAAVERLNEVTTQVWGAPLFKLNGSATDELRRAHRFRVLEPTDLFTLAKDVTRVVLETMDLELLLRHGPALAAREQRPGTRVALQRALATQIGQDDARTLMGPLAGLYDLRLNDAHVAQDKVTSGLQLLGIDPSWPLVGQGAHLLEITALTLEKVAEILETWA